MIRSHATVHVAEKVAMVIISAPVFPWGRGRRLGARVRVARMPDLGRQRCLHGVPDADGDDDPRGRPRKHPQHGFSEDSRDAFTQR